MSPVSESPSDSLMQAPDLTDDLLDLPETVADGADAPAGEGAEGGEKRQVARW